MYQRLVGEGCLSADYFHNRLTLSEAYDYIKGQDRRKRQDWEMARMLRNTIIACNIGEDDEIPELRFPWDEVAHEDEEYSEEDKMAELTALAHKLTEEHKKRRDELDKQG